MFRLEKRKGIEFPTMSTTELDVCHHVDEHLQCLAGEIAAEKARREAFYVQVRKDFYVQNYYSNEFTEEADWILKTEAIKFERLYSGFSLCVEEFYCTKEAAKYKEKEIKEWAKEVQEFRKKNK
jgi:hypothetical protein